MWKQAIIADIIRLKISFRKERRLESGQGRHFGTKPGAANLPTPPPQPNPE